MASDNSSGAGSSGHSRRARFDASDPHRPTVNPKSYGQSPSPPQQSARLAERRGAGNVKNIGLPPDSPGGPEPPHKSDDEDEDRESGTLFSIPVMRTPSQPQHATGAEGGNFQHFYPPPLAATPAAAQAAPAADNKRTHIPNPAGVSRLSSTASNATTRASRGSPPPPETPIDPSGGPTAGLSGIEARYAASGIPGTNTLNEMQAQSAAAAARRAHYEGGPGGPKKGTPVPIQQPQPREPRLQAHPAFQGPQTQGFSAGGGQAAGGQAAGGRWSPTERPGSNPHGPPIAFQGAGEEVESRGAEVPAPTTRNRQPSYPAPSQQTSQLEAGMGNLNMSPHDEPPPAYEPPAAGSVHSPYPNEKGIRAHNASPAQSAASNSSRKSLVDPNLSQHPAFANARQQPSAGQSSSPAPHGMAPINVAGANQSASPGPSGAGPALPPPLPEGWIAHLDNNSGQYYYIHLPTQSTQWEFPKGPTPLNLEPMSPTGTVGPGFGGGAAGFGGLASPVGSVFKQPLASPGFGGMAVPQSATYDRNSMLSMNSLASPTAAGFTGPPPAAGVDLYKVAPTNGVYFGPYLRYTNMDLERGLWLGSIMLVTDAAQPPTIHIHQSQDLSPNPRQLKAHPIHSHQRWIFYRYDVDLRMEEEGASKWTYAITSHLGCTRYEFLVAGRYENSWRFVAHSGNDFALNVSANERTRLGGVGLMWKDVLLKHSECGGFHTQIGLGGQIYADRLWKDIPALKQWTQTSGKENRKNAPWSPKLDEDVSHAFFHYYTSHLDQPCIREAFAQIPQVSCLDDHDIFDGYGSYPEYMQQSHVFKNLGRIGIDMYLLFQHHTTHEILRAVSNDIDLFTITGQGWHFLKYLGPAVVLVGPDTRSERNTHQVMAGPTYQGLFPKVAVLPPSVQHCLWLFPVPVVYPRLEAVEQVAHVATTGKKVVTGGFNMLGKVAGGVAGVIGAKGVVQGGFDGVKRAVGKSGLMQNVLSPFGEVEVLDELRDMWTHESKVRLTTHAVFRQDGLANILTCNAGPRAHLHHPHPPRHLPQQIHAHDLPLRQRQRLRRRPRPRPLPPLRPQNNVPAHLRLHRQRASTLLRDQTPPQQQTPLHPAKRAPQYALPTDRHEGRHDGDIRRRRRWQAEGGEKVDGEEELLGVCGL